MARKMKLPFLNKNTPSSSFSSNLSSSSSSWPWPSSHRQNPKKISPTASYAVNIPKNANELEPPSRSFSSSSFTTEGIMENPPEIECIENVIRGLKSSKRLIFEHSGASNSILEEATKREKEQEEEEEDGFMLLSLESNDPYYDFKKSMEAMVESHAIQHDWISLEKLLFWFLKVNVKTSHKYIYDAFVDLLLNLAVGLSKNISQEPLFGVVVEESPSYTSFSSSDETSSTQGKKSRDDIVCCLSSLFEMEEKTKDNFGSSGYASS